MNSVPKNSSSILWKLSGEDYTIIKGCSPKIQSGFSVIGWFVVAILLCCFLSAMYFTDHLFHNKFYDIGVGLVWGYIVTNMYVFLLYTISPSLLPVKNKKEKKRVGFTFNFSMILRVFIVFLLAVITAQPLNILILKPSSIAFAFDIKELLAYNPFATLITIFVISIFLLPIYLKYRIRKLGDFYQKKALIKERFIKDDYEVFKGDFKQMMERNVSNYNKQVWLNLEPYLNDLKKINPKAYQLHYAEIKNELAKESISKYEYWANPPFRTIRKNEIKNSHSESDLLNQIYNAID